MLQVQQDGKLLVTPEVTSSTFAVNAKWLVLLLLCFGLLPLGYVLAGVVGIIAFVCGLVTFYFFFTALSNNKNLLKGGRFLVEAGRLTHKQNHTDTVFQVSLGKANIQLYETERGSFCLSVDYLQNQQLSALEELKPFICTGLSQQEAVAIQACLQGKKIGLNKKNIKMQSGQN